MYAPFECMVVGEGVRGVRWQSNLVPMLEQNNNEKEYFFQSWAVHSAVII